MAEDVVLLSADGTRLVARRTGKGPPVVLVHGSGGGLHSWAPVAELLATDHEVWTYARRGYGPSEVSTGPGRFADDVADLRAVVEAAGPPAHVVGASCGALVALHAVADAAFPVRSLALYEPPLFAIGPRTSARADEFRRAVDLNDMHAASAVLDRVTHVPDEVLALFAAAPPPEPAEERRQAAGWQRDLEAIGAADPDPRQWAAVTTPVLLAQGADTWEPMPTAMDALAAVLPDVRRARWDGQSHFATATAPQLVTNTLREWLRGR